MTRALRGNHREHILIDPAIRLDIIDGTVLEGPVYLHFDLVDDRHLQARIGAICALTSAGGNSDRQHLQLARRVRALRAIDARNAGASLKEIADQVLGPGDWPGDGEHRKSLIRRMLTAGEQLVRAGPRAILAC